MCHHCHHLEEKVLVWPWIASGSLWDSDTKYKVVLNPLLLLFAEFRKKYIIHYSSSIY